MPRVVHRPAARDALTSCRASRPGWPPRRSPRGARVLKGIDEWEQYQRSVYQLFVGRERKSGLCQAKERPEAFKPSDARLPMSTADRFSSPGSIPFRRWAFLVAPVRVHRRPTSRGMVLSVSSADRVSWRNPFHTTRPFRGPFHLHRWPLLIAACPCPPPTRFSWRGALSVSASDRSRSLGPCPCSPLTVSRHLSVFTTDRFPSRGVRVHDSPFSSRGPAMSTRDRCAVSAKFPFVITN